SPHYLRGEGQALGEESEEAGVGGGVGRVGDLQRGLDDFRMLPSETVQPGDAQVVYQCGSNQRLALVAAPGQHGSSDQVGPGMRVTCSILRMAESHQEIGAL